MVNQINTLICKLIDYARINSNVVHIGAFGTTVQLLSSGFHGVEGHIHDLDLLFILNCDSPKERKAIADIFLEYNPQIVWGDDENYYYGFRLPDTQLIDLEIFQFGSSYYLDNQLLGLSIFSNYTTLYINSLYLLSDIILLPTNPLSFEKRVSLVLNDRKGFAEFVRKLNEVPNNCIDPRRIITTALANYVWALSGDRPKQIASSFSYAQAYLPNQLLSEVKEIVATPTDMIVKNHTIFKNRTIQILQSMIFNLNSLLVSSEKLN